MAELVAASPLAGVLVPGRCGEASGLPGVVAEERTVDGCVHVAARATRAAAVMEAMRGLGLELPSRPGWSDGNWSDGNWSDGAGSDGGRLRAVWVGLERWLLFGAGDLEHALRDRLAGLASVSDQADSRTVLRLSGPRVRDALARGLPLDLHPRVFRTGDAAVTLVAQIGVVIWQLDEAPTYDLAVARSYAAELGAWLIGAAAEYGLLVA